MKLTSRKTPTPPSSALPPATWSHAVPWLVILALVIIWLGLPPAEREQLQRFVLLLISGAGSGQTVLLH